MRHTVSTFVLPAALVATLVVATAAPASAQGRMEDYKRAERFLAEPIKQLVYDGQVDPHWIGKSTKFWYVMEGPAGKQFLLADAATASKAPAFDHARLAASLSTLAKKALSATALPFDTIQFTADSSAVRVPLDGRTITCALASYDCIETPDVTIDEEGGPPGPPRPGRSLPPPRTDKPSPDGKLIAFVENHNLWIRNAKTGERFALTQDGERHYDYATPLPSPIAMVAQGTEDVVQAPAITWSPDSKKIVTYVMDQRNFPRLSMTQSTPPDQFRPKYFTYAYPLPIDNDLPTATIKLFDVDKRRQIPISSARPIAQLYYGGPSFEWTADSTRVLYREIQRGYEHIRYRDINVLTGASRDIVDETGGPLVSNSILLTRAFNGGNEVIWSAERDGWNHFYLYDAQAAALKNQITKGEWVVRAINHVDEQKRTLYFSGAGRESGRDPYLRHVYRIGLDGSGLTLLTPEDADHNVSFSPDGAFFVDAFSRPNVPTVSVVRRSSDGSVIGTLEKAEFSKLTALGWTPPEPFTVKASDGKTDLYGLIWRPTNFDPKKSYPVIENIYTGPHSAFVPKTFAAYRHAQQAIAELGFISVFVDGRGTALRSRAFRDTSYKNLGGGAGGDDHITVMKAMAKKYPYMDLARVGVWGHSAGGYDSTHAILTHPEFYKVAVSSAGCHDNRMDKSTWNEQWMGWPVDKAYEENSNYSIVDKLKGKLFLAHGDVDENVPISATIKLVDALVKANKDFDFLVMPNAAHSFGNHPYFVRRRWDYFVQHLLGVAPPSGFKIGEPAPPATATSAP